MTTKRQNRKARILQRLRLSAQPTTRLTLLVANPWFNTFWNSLIVASVVLNAHHAHIGMVAALSAQSRPAWYARAEQAFSCLFVLEIVIRVAGMRWGYVCGQGKYWRIFDALVVMSTAVVDITNKRNDFMRMLRGIRVIRLLRAIKGARMLMRLRLMVACMLNCVSSLFWALVVILLVLCFFAILFLQAAEGFIVAGKATPQTLSLLQLYYADIPTTMLSLFMAVTGGVDWIDIYKPMRSIHTGWGLCFLLYVFFVVLGVFNVFIGLFVEQALDSSQMDNDLILQADTDKAKAFMKDVKKMFKEIDTHEQGTVSVEQFMSSQRDPRIISYMQRFGLSMIEPSFLFRLLDKDGSDTIELQELVVGLKRCSGQARSSDMLMLIMLVRSLRDEVKHALLNTQERFCQLESMAGFSTV